MLVESSSVSCGGSVAGAAASSVAGEAVGPSGWTTDRLDFLGPQWPCCEGDQRQLAAPPTLLTPVPSFSSPNVPALSLPSSRPMSSAFLGLGTSSGQGFGLGQGSSGSGHGFGLVPWVTEPLPDFEYCSSAGSGENLFCDSKTPSDFSSEGTPRAFGLRSDPQTGTGRGTGHG